MSYLSRQSLRRKAKEKFKEFKKTNKEYKNVRFSDFFKLYKAGLVQVDESHALPPEKLEEDMSELESIILDDDIEEEEDNDNEDSE